MTGIDRLRRLKVLAFNVDGIFTDENAFQFEDEQAAQAFSVRDTVGLRALRAAGFKVVVLSSGRSKAVQSHFVCAGVDLYMDGVVDRYVALSSILKSEKVGFDELGYITCNVDDIHLMSIAGFSATVPSAHSSLIESARFVTSRESGDGAVLEFSNLILQHIRSVASADRREPELGR